MRSEIAISAKLLLLATTMLCISCRSSVTTEFRSVSPDGEYAATLKVKDCGAGCSPSATVTLHDLHNRIGKGDIEVFDGVGGWPIETHWIDPQTLAVVFCNGSRFKVRSSIGEGRLADEGKPWSEIMGLVVNDKKMVINAKAYCRFPEPPPGNVPPPI